MKAGYTIRIEQHEKVRELTGKIEALMEGEDPRVRIAALAHQMACAVEDLSEKRLPHEFMEKLAKRFLLSATEVATTINPFSRDY